MGVERVLGARVISLQDGLMQLGVRFVIIMNKNKNIIIAIIISWVCGKVLIIITIGLVIVTIITTAVAGAQRASHGGARQVEG